MMPPSQTGSGCVALSGSNQPVVGLTTYLQRAVTGVWDVKAAFLPEVYFASVIAAGGIATLLPPQRVSNEIAHRVLDGIDGLIIAGGLDVDPARYGQAAHETTDRPSEIRDEWETALLTAAIERELPFLAICRGAQVLNVALGGTLHQHLPDVIGSTKYQLGNGEFAKVDVQIDTDSRVGRLVGDDLTVEVYHHQAIDLIAPGLRVTARSHDGVIEAVELDSVPFGVAVQWHPEQSPEDVRLFAGLVDAARTYRTALA